MSLPLFFKALKSAIACKLARSAGVRRTATALPLRAVSNMSTSALLKNAK